MGIAPSKKKLEMKAKNEVFNTKNKELLDDILKLIEIELDLNMEENNISLERIKEFSDDYYKYCEKYIYSNTCSESFFKIINIRYYYHMVISKKIKNFRVKDIINETFNRLYRNYYDRKYEKLNQNIIQTEIELK